MRIPLLVLALALVTAGCFGGDDEAGDGTDGTTTTPPTDTPTTTTPEPTTPTDDGSDENETTPPPPSPMQLCAPTHDFATAPGDPADAQAPVVVACGDVPEGYSTIDMNVTWTLGAPAYVGTELTVALVDPAGTVVGSCTGPAPGDQAAPEPCAVTATSPATGAWSVQFTGNGAASATATVNLA